LSVIELSKEHIININMDDTCYICPTLLAIGGNFVAETTIHLLVFTTFVHDTGGGFTGPYKKLQER
jgi:hypothetical protein